jgi:hypothetical protein
MVVRLSVDVLRVWMGLARNLIVLSFEVLLNRSRINRGRRPGAVYYYAIRLPNSDTFRYQVKDLNGVGSNSSGLFPCGNPLE